MKTNLVLFRFFTTVSVEKKSMFGTYHIEDIGCRRKPEILETLASAIERPYGPKLKLDLKFYDYKPVVEDILVKYKDNITGMQIPLRHDNHAFLLKESLYLKHLEQIDLNLDFCESSDCDFKHLDLTIELCCSIISRYDNQLKHFGIYNVDAWMRDESEINRLPSIPNLESLAIGASDLHCRSFMETVNFKNITKLKIENFEFEIRFGELNIKDLKVLSLSKVHKNLAVTLLKQNLSTLTKLEIGNFEYLSNDIFKEIKFSNLKYLKINKMDEINSLTLIQNSKNTIEEICLCGSDYFAVLDSFIEIKLPRLKIIHFDNYHTSKLVYSLLRSCNVSTTEILIDTEKISNKMCGYLLRNAF